MTGQVIIITGSNTGIGLETAIALARSNATLILACRDKNRGEAAVKRVIELTSNKNVTYMNLDLQDLKSVESFSEAF